MFCSLSLYLSLRGAECCVAPSFQLCVGRSSSSQKAAPSVGQVDNDNEHRYQDTTRRNVIPYTGNLGEHLTNWIKFECNIVKRVNCENTMIIAIFLTNLLILVTARLQDHNLVSWVIKLNIFLKSRHLNTKNTFPSPYLHLFIMCLIYFINTWVGFLLLLHIVF